MPRPAYGFWPFVRLDAIQNAACFWLGGIGTDPPDLEFPLDGSTVIGLPGGQETGLLLVLSIHRRGETTMSTVLGAPARLVLAFAASTFLLLGLASSANAATYAQIQSAQPGDTLTLSPSVTLTPGTITQAGDTLEISGATVTYGEAGSGEGVTAVATADSLTLTGGSFTFKDKIATGTFTPDADDPMTFALGDTAAAESTGSLVPAPTAAPAALRTFAISGEAAEDAALGLLPTIPADNGPNFYTIDINANGGTINVNLRQKQRQSSGAVVETGRVLVAVNPINLRYRVEVIDWKFTFGPSNTTLNAVVAGESILNPFEFTGVSGTLTGEAQLVKGLWLTGGTLTWDKTGFHVAGSVRVDCQEGSVSAGLTGDIVDGDDWKFAVSGQTNGGCTVTKDLTLPTGDLTGEIKSEAGAQTGLLEVGGVVQTTLLPEGVNELGCALPLHLRRDGRGQLRRVLRGGRHRHRAGQDQLRRHVRAERGLHHPVRQLERRLRR